MRTAILAGVELGGFIVMMMGGILMYHTIFDWNSFPAEELKIVYPIASVLFFSVGFCTRAIAEHLRKNKP